MRGLQAVCRKHGLPVHGNKTQLFEKVKMHFHQLYIRDHVMEVSKQKSIPIHRRRLET